MTTHRFSYFGEVPKGYEQAPWAVLPDGSVVFTPPEKPPVIVCRGERAAMKESEYEAWIKLMKKGDRKLEGGGKVSNKILMQCGGDGCEFTAEIAHRDFGRPPGWFAVDVAGQRETGEQVSLSQILCPACFLALGIKLPKLEVAK